MKKLTFAVQVFGLILALPLYAFLELNHVSKTAAMEETIPGTITSPASGSLHNMNDSTIEFDSQLLAFAELTLTSK